MADGRIDLDGAFWPIRVWSDETIRVEGVRAWAVHPLVVQHGPGSICEHPNLALQVTKDYHWFATITVPFGIK
jgi:hypothetical protein